MSEQRIALRGPDGEVVKLATAPTGPKQSTPVRRYLRQIAVKKHGEPWHALWLRGYRVGTL